VGPQRFGLRLHSSGRRIAATFAYVMNEDRALGVAEHRDSGYFAPLTPNGGRGVRLLALGIDLMRDGLGDTLIEAVGQQHGTAPPLRKVRPQKRRTKKKPAPVRERAS
jgi:hypothetical protein